MSRSDLLKVAACDGFNAPQAEWRIMFFHDRNDGAREASSGSGSR
jgi:hypothetical protein